MVTRQVAGRHSLRRRRPWHCFGAVCTSLLIASCSREPPRSTPAPHPCAAIDQANRALLTRASASDAGAASADFYESLRAATVCKETQYGAWAIELSSLDQSVPGEISARWS